MSKTHTTKKTTPVATATYETLDRDPELESLWGEYYANKDKVLDEKFGTNKFAKKYKNHLGFGMSENFVLDDAIESAEQVKSWSRHERAGWLVTWLKGRPDITRGELYVAILVGSLVGNVLTNL